MAEKDKKAKTDKTVTAKDSKPETTLSKPSEIKIDIKLEMKKLHRVIYLTNDSLTYVAGDPESYFLKHAVSNLAFINGLLTTTEDVENFLSVLKKANNDENLPRRITLLYVLSYALRNHSPDNKIAYQLSEAVLEICKDDEEFFKFIQVFAMMKGRGRDGKKVPFNKIPSSMSRVIRKFLEKKSPSEYAKAVSRTKGYHGWQYKDLIKLSHYKSETPEKLLVTEFVLFGLTGVRKPKIEELKSIYNSLKDWSALGRKETSVPQICKQVEELKPNYRSINGEYIKNEEIWGALIPHLPVEQVMQLLPKLHKLHLLQPTETSIVHGKVLSVLSISNVRCNKVNPLETFTHLKNFEKGGKPIDPQYMDYLLKNKYDIKYPASISPDNQVLKALHKCMLAAYPTDPTLWGMHKRIVFAMDVTDTTTVCFRQRNITCLEGQLALAMYYSKTERNIDIMVFDGAELKKFDLDKGSYEKNLKKLKEIKSNTLNPTVLFDWALNAKKKVDIFICALQSGKSFLHKGFRTNIKDGFRKYQSANIAISVKLVVLCLGLHNVPPYGERMNCLTIGGFCPEIPKVIYSFAKGNINPIKAACPKKKE